MHIIKNITSQFNGQYFFFFFFSGTQNNCLKMDGILDFMKWCWLGTHYALETHTEPNKDQVHKFKIIKKPPKTNLPQSSRILWPPRAKRALAPPAPSPATQKKGINLVWRLDYPWKSLCEQGVWSPTTVSVWVTASACAWGEVYLDKNQSRFNVFVL